MARTPSFPPKIQINNGQERIRIKGKDIYLGPAGSDKAKANYARIVAEMTGQAAAPPPVLSDPTVAEAIAAFMERRRFEHGDDCRENENFRYAFRPLLRLHGKMPAKEFDASMLEDLQVVMAKGNWMNAGEKEWYTKRKKPLGWSAKVVNRNIVRIRTAWKWIERKKLVPAGSYAALLTVEPLTRRTKFVRHTDNVQPSSYRDVLTVKKHCPGCVGVMLQLQWITGMRSAEVCIMRTCDIDRSTDVWVYRPAEHKNKWRGHDRVVLLGPKCQRLLLPLLQMDQPQAFLFRPRIIIKKEYYDRVTYSQAVNRAAKAAGVKLHPYQGRHAAARRIKHKYGADAARSVLGQKSIDTLEHYTDIDLRQASDVMREAG